MCVLKSTSLSMSITTSTCLSLSKALPMNSYISMSNIYVPVYIYVSISTISTYQCLHMSTLFTTVLLTIGRSPLNSVLNVILLLN